MIVICIKIQITIAIADGADSKIYSRNILDTTIDFCKVQSLLRSSPLIRVFMKKKIKVELNKIKCPYIKVNIIMIIKYLI